MIHAVRAQLHLGIRCVFPFDLPRFSLLHSGSACKCLLSFHSQITDSIQDVPLTIHPGHYRMAGPCHHKFGLMNHYTFRRPLVLVERQSILYCNFLLRPRGKAVVSSTQPTCSHFTLSAYIRRRLLKHLLAVCPTAPQPRESTHSYTYTFCKLYAQSEVSNNSPTHLILPLQLLLAHLITYSKQNPRV